MVTKNLSAFYNKSGSESSLRFITYLGIEREKAAAGMLTTVVVLRGPYRLGGHFNVGDIDQPCRC